MTDELYIKSIITVHGTFTYLGSTLTSEGCLDAEIHLCIQKVSMVYGMLEKLEWANSNNTHKTKMNAYKFCVLNVVWYSSETLLLKIVEHFQ